MGIRIVTDSAADLEKREIDKYSVLSVPLKVSFGDTNYQDGVTLAKERFYELLQTNEEFPKTSQPSPADFYEIFMKAKESGDSVVAIMISSALSGTYQSAVIAKNMTEYEDIHIFDSRSATGGEKIYVIHAAKWAEEGHSAKDIINKLENIRGRSRLFASLDTLEYLYKGGRLSKAAAGIGTLARLKPIITLTPDGEVTLCEKCIGRKSSLEHLVKWIEKTGVDESLPIYFAYSQDRSVCDKVMEKVAALGYDIGDSVVTNIGPTIGSHIGVGAVGIVYFVPEN